jgi:hypothetical protein
MIVVPGVERGRHEGVLGDRVAALGDTIGGSAPSRLTVAWYEPSVAFPRGRRRSASCVLHGARAELAPPA